MRRVGCWLNQIRSRLAKQFLQGSQLSSDRSAEEAVIADLHKSMRENMLKETLEKLLNRKRTLFELTGIGSAVLKGDLRTFHGTTVVKSKQTAIADGDAMDIRRKILEGSLTISNRLAIHDPLLRPDLGGNKLKEFQFLQTASEGSSKQFGESAHWQEESLARW